MDISSTEANANAFRQMLSPRIAGTEIWSIPAWGEELADALLDNCNPGAQWFPNFVATLSPF